MQNQYFSSVCFVAVTLAASVVTAGPRGNWGGGQHWGGQHLGRGNWAGGQHWSGGNWHHHYDHFNDVTFIGGFGGFPFWGWGYPYGYYDSYPYGYNGYYGNGYYGGGYYGYRYPRTYYARQGHNYGYVGHGYRSSRLYYGRQGHR